MLDTKKPIVQINLTPLVDVSLVLVVIFMATAPMFLQSGIIVTSGNARIKSAGVAQAESILVRLTGSGIVLNQKNVSETELPTMLKAMLIHSQDRKIIIRPDREVKHGRVIRIMDLAKQAGAGTLVILGDKQNVPGAAGKSGKSD